MADHDFAKLLATAMTAKEAIHDLQAPDGTRYRIEEGPSPHIRRQVSPIDPSTPGFQITIWEPGPDRPEDFPSSAPWVPDTEIVTMRGTTTGTNRAMEVTVFSPVADPEVTARDVREQGRRAGWTDGKTTQGILGLIPTRYQQQRGHMGRSIAGLTFQKHRLVFTIDLATLERPPAA